MKRNQPHREKEIENSLQRETVVRNALDNNAGKCGGVQPREGKNNNQQTKAQAVEGDNESVDITILRAHVKNNQMGV